MPTNLPPNYVPGAPRAPVPTEEEAPTSSEAPPPRRPWPPWAIPLALFLLTLVTVFLAGAGYVDGDDASAPDGLLGRLAGLGRGWPFAVPLMAILVTHELGHYFAARYHRVPASLPHFIPLPVLSPFGTMGAVISMPNRIKSRNALLDIGAAGPIAGLLVAIPVLVIGLAQSPIIPLEASHDKPILMEGQCLLYSLIKLAVKGPIPDGYDVNLSATAFAGWAGLLVTSLNLLPIGQLDGGHIAYALLGPRHERLARVLHFALPLVYAYNVLVYRSWEPGLVWLIWFALLFLVRSHPPTEPGELSRGRAIVAVLCMVLFVMLFMPTPLRIIE